jgi:HSP20 family protein
MSYLTVRPQRTIRPWPFSEGFEDTFHKMLSGAETEFGYAPAVDVQETKEAYIVEADIPGIKKEDIKIEVLEDTITIQGSRNEENEEKRDNYHRIERSFGSFKRSFRIPGGFQHDEVKATFTDGVLRLNLPKQEELKAKQIEVSGN